MLDKDNRKTRKQKKLSIFICQSTQRKTHTHTHMEDYYSTERERNTHKMGSEIINFNNNKKKRKKLIVCIKCECRLL